MQELTPYQKDAIGRVTHISQDVINFQNDWPRLNTAELLPRSPGASWSAN